MDMENNCLNPCFCGIYSQRVAFPAVKATAGNVLILVFVEFTLRESKYIYMGEKKLVLILVFVEFTLRDIWEKTTSNSSGLS